MHDLDMGGALLILMALGSAQLLAAKFNFGVLLGWSVIASIAISYIVRMISGGSTASLSVYSTLCLVGYCLLPMVGLSLLHIFLGGAILSVLFGLLAASWSAHSAASIHVGLCDRLGDQKWLVFYPYFLFFAVMSLLAIA